MPFITKQFKLCAAHKYWNDKWDKDQNYKVFGDDIKVHGHNYVLDITITGPVNQDSGFIFDIQELKNFISSIRNVEKSIGKYSKFPTAIEKQNRQLVRKSLVAIKFIKKGEVFSKRNIGAKRPGNGISPMRIFQILGKRAKKDFSKDQLIRN